MTINADLLRSSFETILEREPSFTPRFYEILFARYPQARPLFGGNSSRAQQEMLQQALVAVIDNLENATWLASTLSALGAKHVAYGVTRDMYAWVGDALLATLAEIMANDWNEDVANAWQEAYGVICDLMFQGMTDAEDSATVCDVAQKTVHVSPS